MLSVLSDQERNTLLQSFELAAQFHQENQNREQQQKQESEAYKLKQKQANMGQQIDLTVSWWMWFELVIKLYHFIVRFTNIIIYSFSFNYIFISLYNIYGSYLLYFNSVHLNLLI